LLKDRTFKNLTPPLGGEFQNLQVYDSGGWVFFTTEDSSTFHRRGVAERADRADEAGVKNDVRLSAVIPGLREA